jgi:hypothetical protein
MKRTSLLILLLLFLPELAISQKFSYREIKETNEVTSFEKHVFKFNYLYTYDTDFEVKSKILNHKTNLLIEKVDKNINGRLTLLESNGEKTFLEIISCYEKTYNDSRKKYFKFTCKSENGTIVYFNLDRGNNWRLWTNFEDNERIYFVQNIYD